VLANAIPIVQAEKQNGNAQAPDGLAFEREDLGDNLAPIVEVVNMSLGTPPETRMPARDASARRLYKRGIPERTVGPDYPIT
jgi:hypothetical protein